MTPHERKKHAGTLARDYAIGSYCSSTAWGGLEMNVLRFLVWMSQRGWQAVLYAHPHSMLYRNALETQVMVRAVKSGTRLGGALSAYRVAGYAGEDNLRFLLVHQSPDILAGVLARLFSGRFFRLIYSQHMHIGGNKKDMLHSMEYRRLDAWVTPIQWLADRVVEKTNIPPEKIHVIPRGIELERFTLNRPDKRAARQKLNLPEDILLAGVVGRLDPKKCQDTAIKAVANVRRSGHPLCLLIVGDQTLLENTGYPEYLRQLVNELGLQDVVHFRPHQRQPEYAYAALDIFVLPSQSETYGMVTIEALASGLPVIGTDDGGTIDLIDHEKNGLRYTPQNDDELTAALLRYITQPEFAQQMATQAKQDALDKYSHTRQCEGWERLFGRLSAGDTLNTF